MAFSQFAHLVLLGLSVFSLVLSTFCQIRRLENRVWIRCAAILISLGVIGGVVGNLSELLNGGIVGAIAFGLSSILLVLMQVWIPTGCPKHSAISGKEVAVGKWVRRSAGLGVCAGIVVAIGLVLATDDSELELVALIAPFLCGVLGLLLQTAIQYPSFGIAMLVFVVGGVSIGMAMNYFEDSAQQKVHSIAKEKAERAKRRDLMRLAQSAKPGSTMDLFLKLWKKRPLLRLESSLAADPSDLVATLREQSPIMGRWQMEVVPSRDATIEIEFLECGKFEMEVVCDGKQVSWHEGIYDVESVFLRLESDGVTLLLKIH